MNWTSKLNSDGENCRTGACLAKLSAWVLLLLILFNSSAIGGNGWAHSPEYIARKYMAAFEGKPVREIARYLAHPNSGPYGGAVLALARHGEKALPLLQKLLGDTNPWIRAGAIATLSEIYGQKEESKEPRKITSQLDQVTAKIANLIDDPHPAPQAALGQFIAKTRLETGSTKKIILMMAASAEPSVRFQTLRMGRYWLKDKETVVEIGRLVSGAPDGNTPNHWNWAHLLLQRYKKDPICRKAIPVMAEFLYEKANVIPVRGFFSDGAQNRAMDIMLTQWDREVEKMPHVVKALCRCHVRLPYSDYPGWARCRDLTKRLLEKLTAVSAPTIRECIEEEKRWLNRASKEHIFALSSKTRKNQFSQSIDELERIAKTVESGNCFKFEVPKEKEDRKGEQKEELPDLEDDLDLDL